MTHLDKKRGSAMIIKMSWQLYYILSTLFPPFCDFFLPFSALFVFLSQMNLKYANLELLATAHYLQHKV